MKYKREDKWVHLFIPCCGGARGGGGPGGLFGGEALMFLLLQDPEKPSQMFEGERLLTRGYIQTAVSPSHCFISLKYVSFVATKRHDKSGHLKMGRSARSVKPRNGTSTFSDN